MSRNLIGYFRGVQSDILYSVKVISDTNNKDFTEVMMAGDEPFVVDYNNSKTPFDEIRNSTAKIRLVCDEYLLDIFSPLATGTKVILTNETDNIVEWVGYLKPNLYNQGYVNEYETIELEASDYLSALQYFDYAQNSTKRSIVTFKTIIDNFMKKVDCKTYYVTTGKKIGNTDFGFDKVKISEQNFFSDDTDDAWTMEDVLTETCKYFGFTAIQYKDAVVFADYQVLSKSDMFSATKYTYDEKKGEFNKAGIYNLGGKLKIHNDGTEFTGTGAQISMDTVYNKVTIKCNQYNLDEFLPDIFEDDNCTNRYGDWNKCDYLYGYGKRKYIDGKGRAKEEEVPDEKYTYVHRVLDNKYFESVYYNRENLTTPLSSINLKIFSSLDKETQGEKFGSITATFRNDDDVAHTIHFHYEYRRDWWDYEHQMPDYDSATDDETFTIGAGETKTVTLAAQWQSPVQQYTGTGTSTYYYRVDNETTTRNIGQETRYDIANTVGATLRDFASYEKMKENKYNFEPTPSLNFTRYLFISQYNRPYGKKIKPYPEGWERIFFDDATYDDFPCIYRLKSGWTLPVTTGSNSFLAINANVIYQRYCGYAFMNPDWVKSAAGYDGNWFASEKGIISCAGSLIFKLGIGNKYWDGSKWSTTNTCFQVPISTNMDENQDADLAELWNTTFHVLNNFSWDEWSGLEGYRIPLDGVDLNSEVTFEVHLPTKLQYFWTTTQQKIVPGRELNGSLWISDLKINIGNRGKDNDQDEDIVYENIVNENSINELKDITLKINTFPGKGKISFSHVGLTNGGYLSTITESSLSNTPQKPEENLIEKYVSQYSSTTKKENATLTLDYNPFTKVEDMWWKTDNKFMVLGQKIDYKEDSQDITLIQIK